MCVCFDIQPRLVIGPLSIHETTMLINFARSFGANSNDYDVFILICAALTEATKLMTLKRPGKTNRGCMCLPTNGTHMFFHCFACYLYGPRAA